jgi:hypothetical protein
VAALVLVGATGPARGQLFLGSRPQPEFEIGPLLVRAAVEPALGPVTVDIYWSLEIPPSRSALDLEQDLYLLWPGEVGDLRAPGAPDPALAGDLRARGFTTLAEGRLPLYALNLYHLGPEQPPEALGGAPFVTYIRSDRAFGLSPPATWIRIPWTPRLANRAWLVDLRLRLPDLVRPKKTMWFENVLRGARYQVSIGYGDVQGRALFPLYLEHRDRQVRLGGAPAELIMNFADADHLKIDQVWPESSSRRLSESLESTEVVSTFLEKSPGVIPHLLTVQFGYFSGLQSFITVLIPLAFFALGNLAAPLLRALALKASRSLAAHVRPGATPQPQEVGQVVPRDTLARLVPGETTADDVIRLCGPASEHFDPLAGPGRRTLIYRGRRMVPYRHRAYWLLSTVSHWDFEEHTTQIEIENDRVRDVQAQVRRSRSAGLGAP